MKMMFKCTAIAAATLALSLQAQAAPGDKIDAFTVVQTVDDITTGDGGVWATQNNPASATIFGGYRDIYVEKQLQASQDGARGVEAGAAGGEFFFSEDTDQVGYAILRWDGSVSNGSVLNPDVTENLGSLLAYGSGVTFKYTSDFVFDISICVYTTLADYSCAAQVTENTGVGIYKQDSVLWTEFVDFGAGADFANVHAIEVVMNALTGQASIDLAFTAPTGIPEPGSIALTGLALLGLGAARRLRKA